MSSIARRPSPRPGISVIFTFGDIFAWNQQKDETVLSNPIQNCSRCQTRSGCQNVVIAKTSPFPGVFFPFKIANIKKLSSAISRCEKLAHLVLESKEVSEIALDCVWSQDMNTFTGPAHLLPEILLLPHTRARSHIAVWPIPDLTYLGRKLFSSKTDNTGQRQMGGTYLICSHPPE